MTPGLGGGEALTALCELPAETLLPWAAWTVQEKPNQDDPHSSSLSSWVADNSPESLSYGLGP